MNLLKISLVLSCLWFCFSDILLWYLPELVFLAIANRLQILIVIPRDVPGTKILPVLFPTPAVSARVVIPPAITNAVHKNILGLILMAVLVEDVLKIMTVPDRAQAVKP